MPMQHVLTSGRTWRIVSNTAMPAGVGVVRGALDEQQELASTAPPSARNELKSHSWECSRSGEGLHARAVGQKRVTARYGAEPWARPPGNASTRSTPPGARRARTCRDGPARRVNVHGDVLLRVGRVQVQQLRH